ncbi:peroxiredoxin [Hymenobacter busanensis]|uniref:Thioredoxin peroxidase n=1 Tax=Hymenobacter busanensis TaxID=2607656 RepID=A0A7L5A000_9BACT|nr:peroxiredoxin [Hymenobacter busanensis]KAA9338470.1 peroxiredoxin [Hymenobacter busanensis]QHJ09104.1 redoxin domain-containing protein [Hymenobacter busanensis]
MALRLGDTAPDFTADSTQGRINFYEYLGTSWGILFSHPADFTPVCTTELGRAANLSAEFARRNTKMMALSVDALDNHHQWTQDIEETQGAAVDYPIVADHDRRVAELYDMIHPNASEKFTVRSVFIIDPAKKVRLTLTYPAAVGRNFDELLRVIDALQLGDQHPVATPVDWRPGDDVIIGLGVKDEDIESKFPQGHRRVKPYLRYTTLPA